MTVSVGLFGKTPIQNPLPYALFIKKVQQGQIENIGFNSDKSRAVVDHKDGYRDIVNLPPDVRLGSILTANIKGKIYDIPDPLFDKIVTKNNAKVKGFRQYNN